eukprot:3687464-Rhodomonas_salina.1
MASLSQSVDLSLIFFPLEYSSHGTDTDRQRQRQRQRQRDRDSVGANLDTRRRGGADAAASRWRARREEPTAPSRL